MGLIKENVWSGNPKKRKKKKTLWYGDDMAQLKRSNNKYYDSAFRYIYRLVANPCYGRESLAILF